MERDYPVGHPAASDYAGEEYIPPRAPWSEDFAPDHPARGGANTSALDTPDGYRDAVNQQQQRNIEHTSKVPTPQPRVPATLEELTIEIMLEGYDESAAADIAKQRFDGKLGESARYLKGAAQSTARKAE